MTKQKKWLLILFIFLIIAVPVGFMIRYEILTQIANINLPSPALKSHVSVEEALKKRRSIRVYKADPITLHQVAQLLWAAQGITSQNGLRTAPSAGALYPLHIYLISGNVKHLAAGVYRYLPEENTLELLASGDKRSELTSAGMNQTSIQQGAIDIIITANYKRTIDKYGPRGERFVDMEAGHVAENIALQTVSLGLGTVTIGGFTDKAVQGILNIPNNEIPLYIMPVGKI